MDRFENAKVFTAVIEAGGFTRAAERLGLSRAATSKHVLHLERVWAPACSTAPRGA